MHVDRKVAVTARWLCYGFYYDTRGGKIQFLLKITEDGFKTNRTMHFKSIAYIIKVDDGIITVSIHHTSMRSING